MNATMGRQRKVSYKQSVPIKWGKSRQDRVIHSVKSCCGGQFGNPEERERLSLEAVTRKWVKTIAEVTSLVYVIVNCKL
jgi:hypothetical protein